MEFSPSAPPLQKPLSQSLESGSCSAHVILHTLCSYCSHSTSLYVSLFTHPLLNHGDVAMGWATLMCVGATHKCIPPRNSGPPLDRKCIFKLLSKVNFLQSYIFCHGPERRFCNFITQFMQFYSFCYGAVIPCVILHCYGYKQALFKYAR
jgi:hypothetical protein